MPGLRMHVTTAYIFSWCGVWAGWREAALPVCLHCPYLQYSLRISEDDSGLFCGKWGKLQQILQNSHCCHILIAQLKYNPLPSTSFMVSKPHTVQNLQFSEFSKSFLLAFGKNSWSSRIESSNDFERQVTCTTPRVVIQ
jgi:hypothetical protein